MLCQISLGRERKSWPILLTQFVVLQPWVAFPLSIFVSVTIVPNKNSYGGVTHDVINNVDRLSCVIFSLEFKAVTHI